MKIRDACDEQPMRVTANVQVSELVQRCVGVLSLAGGVWGVCEEWVRVEESAKGVGGGFQCVGYSPKDTHSSGAGVGRVGDQKERGPVSMGVSDVKFVWWR